MNWNGRTAGFFVLISIAYTVKVVHPRGFFSYSFTTRLIIYRIFLKLFFFNLRRREEPSKLFLKREIFNLNFLEIVDINLDGKYSLVNGFLSNLDTAPVWCNDWQPSELISKVSMFLCFEASEERRLSFFFFSVYHFQNWSCCFLSLGPILPNRRFWFPFLEPVSRHLQPAM